jgi:RNA polymerase sigma-70 factor (ECF subfamily)
MIHDIINGDENAFRQLVDNFSKQVFHICYAIVHNQDDADDLTQEIFVEIFRSISHFRSDARLSTWIYRIAVNKSLNFLRKRKRQHWIQSLGDLLSLQQTEDEKSPENLSDNELRSIRIHQAINSLPENQRSAFLLHKLEDLSQAEIAEIIGTTVKGVESLIHRAKINLQKKIIKFYKNDEW